MILIFAPVSKRSLRGNAVTANRWNALFKRIGFQSRVHFDHTSKINEHEQPELFIFMHATRSAKLMQLANRICPETPRVLCLSGTDIHRDLAGGPNTKAFTLAQTSIELADKIVTLDTESIASIQAAKIRKLAERKAKIIFQSCIPSQAVVKPLKRNFEVTVIGHLRKEKDPFCAALASELLPESSRIQIVQIGNALTRSLGSRAERFTKQFERYRWIGRRSHSETIRLLRRSKVTLTTSLMESGSNLICEAVANQVPVLATRIPGNVGVLGKDYPGYFQVSDPASLAEQLQRFENDSDFRKKIDQAIQKVSYRFRPELEQKSWCELIAELGIEIPNG